MYVNNVIYVIRVNDGSISYSSVKAKEYLNAYI